MKLESVLDQLNSFEKNSFLKIISDIILDIPKNSKEIDKILSSDSSKDIKQFDSLNIATVFNLIRDEYTEFLNSEFLHTTSQLDIVTDILIRDGNCIMQLDWFSRLYENEIKLIKKKVKELEANYESDKSEIEISRRRDYRIYRACLETAYVNDDANNSDRKITRDELSILLTLSDQLELSQEEIKLINYMIIPIQNLPVEEVINDLKNSGVLFYSKKNNTVYIADEVVRVLRKIRGKEVADKFFRRTLRTLREPQINLICKKHNIDWKSSLDEKIKSIIKEGISFSAILANDIHKSGVSLLDRKRTINEICEKGLNVGNSIKGSTIEEKIKSLIDHFEAIEQDEKVGISVDGYDSLLRDLGNTLPKLNALVKQEFELQPENVLISELLLDYNIKPRDLLELIGSKEIQKFCSTMNLKLRGDTINNILDSYKDSDNIFLENYQNIAERNLLVLRENGIRLNDADLGIKFEQLTKKIFGELGFHVDEKLRKSISTKKDKIDVLINLGNDEIIIIECKTLKEKGYNKFSSVSRQLKAYNTLALSNNLRIAKTLLIAPEFSKDFVSDTELQTDINLSLITAGTLIKILNAFKKSSRKEFPTVLLLRDVLIQEDRILRAIAK